MNKLLFSRYQKHTAMYNWSLSISHKITNHYIVKVSVMAWCYGVDKFLEDVKYMLGFYPYPYFFWKWSWKIVSPSIVVVSKIYGLIIV